MKVHSVYRSLNKPLTLLGVERKLFFLILIASFVLFHLTEALLSSVIVFGILWILARAITQVDHQLLRILFTSNRFDARYDPMLWQKGGQFRD